jgi:hypothetical protein
MSPPPERPKIYHITHVDNLARIVADGELISDARIGAHGGPDSATGMSTIKQRRLRLPVRCHPGDTVGDYVPFYFCPRSIMLYVIHCANHPELQYRGGQGPIVHLEADLKEAVEIATRGGRRWAFSLANAGAAYTEFRNNLDALDEIDWQAVEARDFRRSEIKEGKQAEFLVHQSFPWSLISRIGVSSMEMKAQVDASVAAAAYKPKVPAGLVL